jgi:DNA gyrase subunit A
VPDNDTARHRERARILQALVQAIDQSEEVRALIAGSESADAAEAALMRLLGVDKVQARAVLDMQWRNLAARQRQQLIASYDAEMAQIADLESS